VKRQLIFYAFQAMALVWAIAVVLRTVDLGWNPFAGLGLGMFGALPISFLGIRIHSRREKPRGTAERLTHYEIRQQNNLKG